MRRKPLIRFRCYDGDQVCILLIAAPPGPEQAASEEDIMKMNRFRAQRLFLLQSVSLAGLLLVATAASPYAVPIPVPVQAPAPDPAPSVSPDDIEVTGLGLLGFDSFNNSPSRRHWAPIAAVCF